MTTTSAETSREPHDRRRAAAGCRRELSGAQPSPSGRDRRVCAGRRPRPARRSGPGGAASCGGVARTRHRRAGRRGRRGRHHGGRPTRRQRRCAAVHPRAWQGARRGALRNRHRASAGRNPRSDRREALAPERIDPQSAYPRLQREPYGVAALASPFNWPLALTMTKLSSALTAGNTAVVKVPPTCPLAALQLGAAFAAALPPGW